MSLVSQLSAEQLQELKVVAHAIHDAITGHDPAVVVAAMFMNIELGLKHMPVSTRQSTFNVLLEELQHIRSGEMPVSGGITQRIASH